MPGRIGRWIIASLAGSVLLVLGAVLIVTLLVDPNRFKGRIEAAVRQASGRPFTLSGDLSITWFPWLGVRTGAASLGNAPAEDGPAILAWQSARVEARVLPLLRGQLVIGGVLLDAPVLRLRRDAQGRSNWADLLDRLRAGGGTTGPPLELGGVEVRDGTLEYTDVLSGRRLIVSQWRLDAGAWKVGEEVPVTMELTLAESGGAAGRGIDSARGAPGEARLRLSARVRTSSSLRQVSVADFEVSGRLLGGTLVSAGVPLALSVPRAEVQLPTLKVTVPGMTARLAEARIIGSASGEETMPGDAATLRASGPLSLRVPSVRALLTAFGATLPLPLDKSALGPLTLTSTWAWQDGALAADAIEVQVDATKFTGRLARSKAAPPVWSFALHGDQIDLTRYVTVERRSPEPFEFPVAALRGLPVEGEVTFERARLADAQMKRVRLKLELGDVAGKSGEAMTVKGQAP